MTALLDWLAENWTALLSGLISVIALLFSWRAHSLAKLAQATSAPPRPRIFKMAEGIVRVVLEDDVAKRWSIASIGAQPAAGRLLRQEKCGQDTLGQELLEGVGDWKKSLSYDNGPSNASIETRDVESLDIRIKSFSDSSRTIRFRIRI